MSAILFTYFEFFHLASFLYFSSLLICKFLQSIVCKNRSNRVQEETNQTKDGSLDESPGKDENLSADALNWETLIFLPYKSEKIEAVGEICLETEAHEGICRSDSSLSQEYNENSEDGKCGEPVASEDHEGKSGLEDGENCRVTEVGEDHEEKAGLEAAEKCGERGVCEDHEEKAGMEAAEKCGEIGVCEDHEEKAGMKAADKCGEIGVCEYHEEETGLEDGEEANLPREQETHEVRDDGERREGDKDGFVGIVQLTAETSKSSWEWRSSTNYRDSEMEDTYSSSLSSSTDFLFIKRYDEEMLYFDRLTVQKLQETESFRMTNPWPRSISKRIMIKLKGSVEDRKMLWQNEKTLQQDLEAAYVAQICLTWEALNWNYKNLKKLKSGKEDGDSDYYGHVTEQFQQFQVLLRWFIEIEPYEDGRRPEIYARMRNSWPRLLQVPEIREGNTEEEAKEERRMSTAEILEMMEDSVRIFMEFIMTEKSKKCILIRTLFRRNSSPYASRIHAVRKAAHKKREELKETQTRWKCFTIRRRMNKAEDFEVLLALIDVKVVLRVLKMEQINEEQLHWCEEKINKLRVERDRIHRDSCPSFYPSR